MPAETNADRIGKVEQTTATIVERIDNLRREIQRVEQSASETTESIHKLDKQLAIAVREVERVEKKLDEVLAHRWELWKLILAAFLGGVMALCASFLSRSIDRLIGTGPSNRAPSIPATDSK